MTTLAECRELFIVRPRLPVLVTIITLMFGAVAGVGGYYWADRNVIENRLTGAQLSAAANRRSIERMENNLSVIISNQREMLDMMRRGTR